MRAFTAILSLVVLFIVCVAGIRSVTCKEPVEVSYVDAIIVEDSSAEVEEVSMSDAENTEVDTSFDGRCIHASSPTDVGVDEVSIAMSHFGTSYVSPSELFADLGALNDYIDSETFADLGVLVNQYSVQGFERLLASGELEEPKYNVASVVMCMILSEPYENLWKDGFLTEETARSIIDQFDMAG